MKPNYLLHYIANKLQTCLVVLRHFEIETVICNNLELYNQYKGPSLELALELLKLASTPWPHLVRVNQDILFASLSYKEEQFVIGPMRCQTMPAVRFNLSTKNLDKTLLEKIPATSVNEMAEMILLLHNCYADDDLSLIDFHFENLLARNQDDKLNITEQVYQNKENAHYHNPYQQELREQKSIEKGNLQLLKQSWEEVYDGQVGILAKDPVRNFKNLAIVIIALSSRSAMRGGLDPELCYTLSDHFIQQIEEMKSIEEISAYIRQCEVKYTILVKNKSHKMINATASNYLHPFVLKAQSYISSHLHEAISLQELAESIPCSQSYLNTLFQEHFQKSLLAYITTEKMNYAEQLLIYTQQSVSLIATTLGYTSQSYFGNLFKKHSHYTPKEYRLKFGRY